MNGGNLVNIIVIIQARMGSTRLPGKVMKGLYGKSVLTHVIERVKQSKLINDIVIATTTHKTDDIIEKEAQNCDVKCFRGSEEDVLSRYYFASKQFNADVIVRITADCPLYDSKVLDEMIKFYIENNYIVVTNAGNDLGNRTYPRGLDTEIFTFKSLEEAFLTATAKYQREHVTPYLYENIEEIYYYKNKIDNSNYRWTLDTEEDWILIKTIYGYLYKGRHNFYLEDMIELMIKYPELSNINKSVKQKNY